MSCSSVAGPAFARDLAHGPRWRRGDRPGAGTGRGGGGGGGGGGTTQPAAVRLAVATS
ncbi:hypothetical protein [Streptomyces harbinensis]|uniref:hypothetical protein n=1 Tax=Streptomyces harbinensis TaxID=1176198 RepID=UPI0034DF5132